MSGNGLPAYFSPVRIIGINDIAGKFLDNVKISFGVLKETMSNPFSAQLSSADFCILIREVGVILVANRALLDIIDTEPQYKI